MSVGVSQSVALLLPANWMSGEFDEVILGWHSFSNVQTNVWMDDIGLGTSAIGCP
jgi:hypothetical protein